MGRDSIKVCQNKNVAGGVSKRLVTIFVVLTLGSESYLLGSPQLVDQIVAVVAGIPILRSTLEAKTKNRREILVSYFPAKDGDSDLQKHLQDEINLELIRQKAKDVDLGMDKSDIEEEISKFLTQRKLGKKDLLAALKEQGVSYSQYKEDFETQMLVQKFQGRVISPGIKITDKDLEALYFSKNNSTAKGIIVGLNRISTESHRGSKGSSIPQLESIREDVVSGRKSYESLKKDSIKIGLDCVEMEPLDLQDLAQPYRDALSGKGVGEVTEVLSVNGTDAFFQIRSKNVSSSGDFSQKKQELEYELRTRELQRQTLKWLSDMRKSQKIQMIVSL